MRLRLPSMNLAASTAGTRLEARDEQIGTDAVLLKGTAVVTSRVVSDEVCVVDATAAGRTPPGSCS